MLADDELNHLRELSNGFPMQDENGIDLSLIEAMRSLTPAERLAYHDQVVREMFVLRQIGKDHRARWATQRPARRHAS